MQFSGYQLFVKQKLTEFIIQHNIPERPMHTIARMWLTLSDNLREEWKTKAMEESNKYEIQAYQLYGIEKIDELRARGLSNMQAMIEIIKMWNALSEKEKTIWKDLTQSSKVAKI